MRALSIALALMALTGCVAGTTETTDDGEPIAEVEEELARCLPDSCSFNCEFSATVGNRWLNRTKKYHVSDKSYVRYLWRATEPTRDANGAVTGGAPLRDGLGTVRGWLMPPGSPPSQLRFCKDFDEKKSCKKLKGKALDQCRDCRAYAHHFEGRTWAMINTGLKKKLGGESHVYVFNALIYAAPYPIPSTVTLGPELVRPTGTWYSASGWVPESAFHRYGQTSHLAAMPVVKNPPAAHEHMGLYRIVGGDWDDFSRPCTDAPGELCSLKVVKGDRLHTKSQCPEGRFLAFRGSGGPNALHYLGRPGGVANLLYQTPGVGGASVDTFPIGSYFRRAALPKGCGGHHWSTTLYEAADTLGESKAWADKKRPGGYCGPPESSKELDFFYGYVFDGAHRRYGWMAKAALAPAQEPLCGCEVKCAGAGETPTWAKISLGGKDALVGNECQKFAAAQCGNAGKGVASHAYIPCP
jgi:hypothetical protein